MLEGGARLRELHALLSLKNGFFCFARRFISGMATSFRFSALCERPSAPAAQPSKLMYVLKPRAAGLPSKPTHVVL